jgi:YHS domain-containing protein
MNKIMLAILAILMALFTVGPVVAEEGTPGENMQTTCPIMGGKINKDIYTDYKDERVYFCCEGCIPEFQKDPAKYVQKLENEGVTLEKVSNTGLKKESSPGNNASGKQNSACGNCGCDS